MKIEKVFASWKQLIDSALVKYLAPRSATYNTKIYDSMLYAIMPGGKRIRPILLLAAAKACGLGEKDALPAACAIELAHSYSLVHDDLPGMDNAPERRGKPTVHKKFGDGMAVLAGDALLTKAFELMALRGQKQKIKPADALEAVKLFSSAIGEKGMIGGQVADTFYGHKNKARPEKEKILRYIHTHKTGDLIEASVLLGGVIAGAPVSKLTALKSYGRKIGLAFQIVDDLFDLEEDAGKLTYPNFYGQENSRKKAARLIDEAKNDLRLFGKNSQLLSAIAEYVVDRAN